MTSIPKFLIGRNVAITITPQTPDNAGVLTAGSATSMVGKCERASCRFTPRREEISAMDTVRENEVIVKERTEAEIVEIQRYAGSDLISLWGSYDYFLVSIVAGGKTLSFYSIRGDLMPEFQRGKSNVSCSFGMVDAGSNPLYA